VKDKKEETPKMLFEETKKDDKPTQGQNTPGFNSNKGSEKDSKKGYTPVKTKDIMA